MNATMALPRPRVRRLAWQWKDLKIQRVNSHALRSPQSQTNVLLGLTLPSTPCTTIMFPSGQRRVIFLRNSVLYLLKPGRLSIQAIDFQQLLTRDTSSFSSQNVWRSSLNRRLFLAGQSGTWVPSWTVLESRKTMRRQYLATTH